MCVNGTCPLHSAGVPWRTSLPSVQLAKGGWRGGGVGFSREDSVGIAYLGSVRVYPSAANFPHCLEIVLA